MNKRHNVTWCINHLKILRALNLGKKTNYQIYMEVGLTPRTIGEHKKEILECPICHNFVDKTVFCSLCGFRLVESYG